MFSSSYSGARLRLNDDLSLGVIGGVRVGDARLAGRVCRTRIVRKSSRKRYGHNKSKNTQNRT